ncbi:MAG: elongation factor Ts [Candidatus Sungbacteria bacterium]|nr:elongation factor Ts [Candidatus Sungbacteria bacterium]
MSSDAIKELRDKTGVSVMECKKALDEAGGDIDKARRLLQKRFGDIASQKAERATGQGIVDAYVHSNARVGVLVELLCETDFVARNPAFRGLAHDIAMHIAAMNPDEGDLLDQEFIKDPSRKISGIIEEAIGKFGENVKVGRFTRYSI